MTTEEKTKRLVRSLKGEVLNPPPFWLMRQAGRYLPEYRDIRGRVSGLLDLCYTPRLAVEVTLQPLRRFGMDAAILFSDILVVPEALGQRVEFREGEGPILEAVRAGKDLDRLRLSRLDGRLAPVYEAVSELSRRIPKETALIGFAGAPWTVATYMVEGSGGTDFSHVRRWAYADPAGFAELVDLLVEATVAYLVGQVEHGAEVIQLFDSWAGRLDERQFRRWVIEPTAEIVRRLKDACPGTPVIGFPRGCGALYLDYALETGVDGLSLDSTVPLGWAASKLQSLCTLQGNLDNLALAIGGKPLEEEVERIMATLARGPFIFNLGHGILKETPPDNVARLAELIRKPRNL